MTTINFAKSPSFLRRFDKEQKLFENLRKWVEHLGSTNDVCPPFTLMTFNILSQDRYEHEQKFSPFPWPQRCERVLSEINQIKPDILCVQELQKIHIDDIKKKVKCFDYEMIYKKRTGTSTDGCAVFFNKAIFELVDYHDVEFYQSEIDVLCHDDIAMILILRMKSDPSEKLVVATTLFCRDHFKRQDIRLAKTQVLLAELDRLAFIKDDEKYANVILCGTFNFHPKSPAYELIDNGFVKFDELAYETLETRNGLKNANDPGPSLLPIVLGITDDCKHIATVLCDIRDKTMLHHSDGMSVNQPVFKLTDTFVKNSFHQGFLKHEFNFQSVYLHKMNTNDEEATVCWGDGTIADYIFYTSSKAESEVQLVSSYSLPTRKDAINIVREMPNLYYGSDHFSLAAKFQIRK